MTVLFPTALERYEGRLVLPSTSEYRCNVCGAAEPWHSEDDDWRSRVDDGRRVDCITPLCRGNMERVVTLVEPTDEPAPIPLEEILAHHEYKLMREERSSRLDELRMKYGVYAPMWLDSWSVFRRRWGWASLYQY